MKVISNYQHVIEDISIPVNAPFKVVERDESSNWWCFVFEDGIAITLTTFWRVLQNNKILRVSEDEGQLFGLEKPINLIEFLSQKLSGLVLTEIIIRKNTADIVLLITEEIKIEVFISSSGYESYELWVGVKNYIGMGGGFLAIS